jgi:hypothetical protein
METLPKFGISRVDMMKRIARFKDLKAPMAGFPTARRRTASGRFIMSSASSRPTTKAAP